MKHRMLMIAFTIILISKGFSQESNLKRDQSSLKKNVIYGTVGFYPDGLYSNIMGNYERMIFQLPKSFVNSFWIRIGAGPWVAWGDKGINYVSTISAVIGKQSAHLEIGSGVLFTYNKIEKKFHPIVRDRHIGGNIGFRYQKPGANLVFRTGIGWPEGMYLSLGFCF